MKRRMKRNKLLKKALTLGLAAAVAVTSMAPTLGMLEPVVVQADEEGSTEQTTAVEITEVTAAAIKVGSSDDNITHWKKNAEMVNDVQCNNKTITVNAQLKNMDIMTGNDGNKGKKAFPIVVKLDKSVDNSYKIYNSSDVELLQTDVNRVTDSWKFRNMEQTDNSKEYCVVWLNEDWVNAGRKISFDGINKYTIEVKEVANITITSATPAAIGSFAGSADTGFANAAKVDAVTLGENKNITVKAKLGDMTTAVGGTAGNKPFPILVELDNKVSECYRFVDDDGCLTRSTDPIADARVTDAWKCLGYSEKPGDWENQNRDQGNYCIVWLNEEWATPQAISFDYGNTIYNIKVEDTTEYTLAADVTNATVSFEKAGGTAMSASVTDAKAGDVYTITISANEGYYFDNTVVTTLTNDGWTSINNNLKYSKDYTVAIDYSAAKANIDPIPGGVSVTVIEKETAPSVTVSYTESKLTFSAAGVYLINGVETTMTADGTLTISEASVGAITIVKKASDEFHINSEPITLNIKKAPKIPSTVKGEKAESIGANGKITGTTTDMEYAKDLNAGEWTGCTVSNTDVTPGAYYVRYKTNDTSDDTAGFTGEATKIIVGESGSIVIDLRASLNDPALGTQTVNYGVSPASIDIKIDNVADNLPATNTAVISLEDDANGFKTLETTTLPAIVTSGNTTITVEPKDNLKVGTYDATLKISYSDGSDETNNAETSVSFKVIVNKVQWGAPTGTVSAASMQSGQISVDMSSVTAIGGNIEYGYALEGSVPESSNIKSVPGFTSVAAGTYYVFVRIAGDDNHTASEWLRSEGTVTVAASTTPTPDSGDSGNSGNGSGSGSGSSSSSGSTSGGTGGTAGTGTTGGTGTTPTPSTPTVTTTPDGTVVSTNKDGAYVDKNGNVAADTLIKDSTGAMHVTDSTGHITKDDVVTTADGTTYVVGAEGNVVVSDIAEIKGNKYVADENGVLVTSAFSSIGGDKYYSDAEGVVKTDGFFNAAGKKYYADEDGVIAVKTLITVNGKKYFATKTGAIATKKIVTTGGKKYFATKTGVIATKKVVTTGGKKYFATKDGSLATNKWVKSGNKKYFCNKKGVITKTKKIKAK